MAEVFGKYSPLQVRTAGVAEASIQKGEPVIAGSSAGLVIGSDTDNSYPILGIATMDFDEGDIVSVVTYGEAYVLIADDTIIAGDYVAAGGTTNPGVIKAASTSSFGKVLEVPAGTLAVGDLALIDLQPYIVDLA